MLTLYHKQNRVTIVYDTVVPRTRFERVTLGLEVLCSIQLSYRGKICTYLTEGSLIKLSGHVDSIAK